MLPKIDPALIGTRLGSGYYASVYEYGADQALKLAIDDGTRDYLEWCYVRGRRYGRGSSWMAHLPWVYSIGPVEDLPALPRCEVPRPGWYALLERYDCTLTVHMGWKHTHWPEDLRYMPELAQTVALLHAELGADATCDLHSGNVMWSAKRGELVVTDPSAAAYSGSYRDTARSMTWPEIPPALRGLHQHLMQVQ